MYARISSTGRSSALLKLMKAIPIAAGRDALNSLEQARRALQEGHVVCIFAEGSISRTGNMLPFKRAVSNGLSTDSTFLSFRSISIVCGGSIFSFKGGGSSGSGRLRVPYPVTVAFGPPLPSTTTAGRGAVGADDARQRRGDGTATGRRRTGAVNSSRPPSAAGRLFCMVDFSTKPQTFGRVTVAALLLSRWLIRHATSESKIGLLFPASVGGALANVATALAGKTSVNFNFTARPGGQRRSPSSAARSRQSLTSRAFLAKVGMEPLEGMVFLEDVLKQVSSFAKLRMLVTAFVLPSSGALQDLRLDSGC
mgnify:CR=1 FL=1